MKKLVCEICGGDSLLKEDAHFRCTGCGACYSTDQLKKILDETVAQKPIAAQAESSCTIEIQQSGKSGMNRQAAKTRKWNMGKIKKCLPVILAVFIPLVLLAGAFELVFTQAGILPRTADAKRNMESHLKFRIENEDITLETIRFDSIDAIQFKTREEDSVGYFAYMERSMKKQNADGTVTEYNSFDELKKKLGANYDPEADVKWAYIATGTYTVTNKGKGEISGEFSFVYVCNVSANYWYYVKEEYGTSLDVLRDMVKSDLTAYVLLTYDIQPNPKIEITSIEKEDGNYTYYTVYGQVVVNDQFGKKYSGKFTAQYQYTSYNHQFRKLSTEVDELTRNLWSDILK